MNISKDELKKIACKAIENNKSLIIDIGRSIFLEPELGFKEFKTAMKIKNVLEKLEIKYMDRRALTGIIAPVKGKKSKLKLAIMAELDAVISPNHPSADKTTGAVHACGHNAMCAALVGIACALKDTNIMDELSGDIVLMAVPAEEYIEIEYRKQLIDDGKILLPCGKAEFIRQGYMDDIDMMIMQHTASIDMQQYKNIKAICAKDSTGFTAKLIKYVGKESHAGGAPHKGINALNAANIGLMAINAQRETFKDEDNIRVHPIITKGGDIVNTVPADVRLETYVRGSNVEAIIDASKKVDRAFKAGGYAVGAETIITDLPGDLPMIHNDKLLNLMYNNLVSLVGEDKVLLKDSGVSGSTDAGDVSHLMPVIHSYFVGSAGTPHGCDFEIIDEETAYILPAKALIMLAIDLLADDAKLGFELKNNFKPAMTKKTYLHDWGKIKI